MKLTYFCPDCWHETDGQVDVCPNCGYDLSAYEQLPYEQKLLCAVRHPVQDIRLLAIQLLGQLRSAAAVPVFQAVLGSEENIFVLREIAWALAQIGDPSSQKLLEQLASHRLPMVQRLARDLLALPMGGDKHRHQRGNST